MFSDSHIQVLSMSTSVWESKYETCVSCSPNRDWCGRRLFVFEASAPHAMHYSDENSNANEKSVLHGSCWRFNYYADEVIGFRCYIVCTWHVNLQAYPICLCRDVFLFHGIMGYFDDHVVIVGFLHGFFVLGNGQRRRRSWHESPQSCMILNVLYGVNLGIVAYCPARRTKPLCWFYFYIYFGWWFRKVCFLLMSSVLALKMVIFVLQILFSIIALIIVTILASNPITDHLYALESKVRTSPPWIHGQL